ncbi:MAG TPA: hypothetical protein VHU80_18375 [Polyangiaceae bacterium]|jgi:hypothetical protein|nr:hypothetical protein [Polyangiaceae bacterium]
MGWRAIAAMTFLLVPAACGGRVIGESPPDQAGTPTADAATSQNQSSSGGSPKVDLDGTLALPDCELGFPFASADGRECIYTYEDRCYATKVKACACACPRKAGTECINGFPEANGTTRVFCQ